MASTLELHLPAPWTRTREDQLTVFTFPGTALRIEVDPLVSIPDDRKTWGERILFRNAPKGGRVDQLDIVDSVGHSGHGCTIVSTKVSDAQGVGVEFRVTFFFEFLYAGGAVVCRVTKSDAERWEKELRAEVIDAIRGARPSFQEGELAHLGDLYDLSAVATIPRTTS